MAFVILGHFCSRARISQTHRISRANLNTVISVIWNGKRTTGSFSIFRPTAVIFASRHCHIYCRFILFLRSLLGVKTLGALKQEPVCSTMQWSAHSFFFFFFFLTLLAPSACVCNYIRVNTISRIEDVKVEHFNAIMFHVPDSVHGRLWINTVELINNVCNAWWKGQKKQKNEMPKTEKLQTDSDSKPNSCCTFALVTQCVARQ